MKYSIPFQMYFRVSVLLFFSCVLVFFFLSEKNHQAGTRGAETFRSRMGPIRMHKPDG